MNYAHIAIPEERHPTAAARTSLNAILGFEDRDEIQDWERYFANAAKVGEFLSAYQESQLSDDEKILLMDLILASASENEFGTVGKPEWHKIETLLFAQYDLHAWTIWKWADIDEETGIPSNNFEISRPMQAILQRRFEDQVTADLVIAEPIQSSFFEFWNAHFEDHKPIGHQLRQSLHPRWARFHSLPEAKRYPHTEVEWSILFDRHNQIADEVLGYGSRCWLVICDELVDREPEMLTHLKRYDFERWFSWLKNDELGDVSEWPVYAAETIWFAGQFNDLFRKIANWEESFVLLVSQETLNVFAPYDGGIDLIVPSGKQASALKAKFSKWRPSNHQGL